MHVLYAALQKKFMRISKFAGLLFTFEKSNLTFNYVMLDFERGSPRYKQCDTENLLDVTCISPLVEIMVLCLVLALIDLKLS